MPLEEIYACTKKKIYIYDDAGFTDENVQLFTAALPSPDVRTKIIFYVNGCSLLPGIVYRGTFFVCFPFVRDGIGCYSFLFWGRKQPAASSRVMCSSRFYFCPRGDFSSSLFFFLWVYRNACHAGSYDTIYYYGGP